MNIKEIALQTIDRLPNEAEYDEIIHALYIQAKFEKGLQEIKEGKSFTHEEAMLRFQKWVK